MTLSEYLNEEGMTETAFAAKLGVSQVTINRYVNGKRFPDRDTIQRISVVTEGKVPPAAWFMEAAE